MSSTNTLLPSTALTFNAFVWGTSWWAFRGLHDLGLHPLWATVFIFLLSSVAIIAAQPRAFLQLLKSRPLWVLLLSAGATNAAFNWGVVIGDVVRVVLLFYLMPLWAAVLAWLVLGEKLTWSSMMRLSLAFVGALVVLWPDSSAISWAENFGLADVLGMIGGFFFALNNIMLRREATQSGQSKAMAMFVGGAVVPALVGGILGALGHLEIPNTVVGPQVPFILGLAMLFLISNYALQYGASRLPANVTAIIMLTEIIFASVSAVILDAGSITPKLAIGGTMIFAAAALSALPGTNKH